MNGQLIYDVGAHVGEDTDFYLRKGFRVVAIEAHPVLAEKLRQRFGSHLSDGSLVVIEAAIAETTGEISFFVNESSSVWGTIRPEWAERNAARSAPSKLIKVRAIRFVELLEKYGAPYYLKIDIEGADLLCLEGLLQKPDRPEFVSIESEQKSWRALLHEFEVLRRAGYSRFKIVDQTRIDRQKIPRLAAEGRFVEYSFQPRSTGLFGKELPGKWLTAREAIRRYRFIFLRYRLFGDNGVLRFLLRIPALRDAFNPPWYDTHATV